MLPPDKMLESEFCQQVICSNSFRDKIAMYDCLETGRADRNYKFLVSAGRKNIDHKRRVDIRDALHWNISGGKVLIASGGAGGDSRRRTGWQIVLRSAMGAKRLLAERVARSPRAQCRHEGAKGKG